jgi:peptide chain release factor subunit 1
MDRIKPLAAPASSHFATLGAVIEAAAARVEESAPLQPVGASVEYALQDVEERAMITAATVRQIREFDTGEFPVISMYLTVPADPRARSRVKTRVNSLLEQVRPLCADHTLDHDARLSVRADLEHIEELAGKERWQPPAVAVFSCSGRNLFEELQLPRQAGDRVVADATPWIRPMMAVLEEFHRAVVLVTDSNSARVWELFQGELHRRADVEHRTLRKRNFAGWYGLREHTVANKADEMEKRHFLDLIEMLDHMFLDPSYELLVLGGHHDTLSRLEAYLPKRLRERLAGTLTVGALPDLESEVSDRASAIVDSWEREEEKRKLQDLFERVATRRPATVGLRECLWAATTGAVAELLIHDEVTAPGVVCPRDGWLGESGGTCPICASKTRQTPDIIDELTERVIDEGGAIEHVAADTELEPHLVGAVLRFPLPPFP